MQSLRATTGLFAVVLTASCASSLYTRDSIDKAEFQPGVTSRHSVVRVLGLPDKVDRDPKANTVLLTYYGEARNNTYLFPPLFFPISVAPTSAPYSYGSVEIDGEAAAVFVFDGNDKLVTVIKPKHKS